MAVNTIVIEKQGYGVGLINTFRLASLSGLVFVTLARAAVAESLSSALSEAYHKNPTLNAARAGQRATDEAVPQALAGWRPIISAQAVVKQSFTDTSNTTNPTVFSQGHNYITPTEEDYTIQLRQPIFNGFRTVESTKVAEAQVKAGQQQLLATEQTVLLNGIQAYLDVIRDRRTLQLRQQNLVVLQDQLKASQARFKAGELTRTDVAQSEAGGATAQAALAGTLAQLKASEATYEQIIGHKPGKLASAPAAKAPASLEQAMEIAHRTNPNILAAAQVVDQTEHTVGVVYSALLPQAEVSGTYLYTAQQNGIREGQTSRSDLTVQGTLTVPIYDGGLTFSQVRAAKQRASQSRISVIDTTRQVRQAVAANWASYTSSKQAVSSSSTGVSASRTAFDGVKQEYQVGSRSTIDVLNAEQTLVNAQISQVALQHDLILASYRLQASIGHLTARYLHLGTIYDPLRNYYDVRDKWIGTDAKVLQ